jgi:hypothetical protein
MEPALEWSPSSSCHNQPDQSTPTNTNQHQSTPINTNVANVSQSIIAIVAVLVVGGDGALHCGESEGNEGGHG